MKKQVCDSSRIAGSTVEAFMWMNDLVKNAGRIQGDETLKRLPDPPSRMTNRVQRQAAKPSPVKPNAILSSQTPERTVPVKPVSSVKSLLASAEQLARQQGDNELASKIADLRLFWMHDR